MTPSDFETRAREYAECCDKIRPANDEIDAFVVGANWSRTETIAEIFGMLRSKDAPTEMHRPYPYNHAWADWLERQLKEGK